ncbi:MAG TPA: M50 family metallopeptidase [Mycobacteriales bacterium]|jgi:hypothetical protein|nr:M50 family metallopeptidase [Mycobacteriales bacterium]
MFAEQAAPPHWVIWTSAAAALVVVTFGLFWFIARNVITIAHEGGHALVALISGRKLGGIRLHSDTSGLTVSSGKPTGPGMVFTGLAGYIAPSLLGLGCVGLLNTGRITVLLWACITLLLGMLIFIRNLYGVFSVVATGLIFGGLIYFGTDTAQGGFAYFATWFLLLGGVRPVIELQRKRHWGEAHDSDADQLARLTRVPGLLWVLLFAAVCIGCLGVGLGTLLPSAGDR